MDSITITLRRPNQDITVAVGAHPMIALDENGNEVQLTRGECQEVGDRVAAGENETGC